MNDPGPHRSWRPIPTDSADTDEQPSGGDSSHRSHHWLVRIGRSLLVLGPALILIHLAFDLMPASDDDAPAYSPVGYDVAVILIIIGIALVCREAPDEQP